MNYLQQRTGHRLELDGSGHHGRAAKIYGSGSRNQGKIFGGGARSEHKLKMELGLMPGEHILPHHKMAEALFHYKVRHGLHGTRGHGYHPHHHHAMMLPGLHAADVIHKILDHHENVGGGSPRGGFLPAFLPLAAGAAMPFLAEAVKGLLGGIGKSGGEHLVHKLAGSGLGIPKPIGHDHMRHYVIHGEGFKDLLGRSMKHLKRIVTSEPARKMGSAAFDSLREAFQHAIIERIEHMAGKVRNKIMGTAKTQDHQTDAGEVQPDAPESADEFHDAEDGAAPRGRGGGQSHMLHGLVGRGGGRKRKYVRKASATTTKKRKTHHRVH